MEAKLTLSRMEIEEVGFNPERLANAIPLQLQQTPSAIPIHSIAHALDITEIRSEPLTNLEGALLMPPSRKNGAILVNSSANHQRQRFTIAHELGHYLNLHHRPKSQAGFECTRKEMGAWDTKSSKARKPLDPYQQQEIEANRFAIELLAPKAWLKPFRRQSPEFSMILDISKNFNLSKEAAARRFVELSDYPIAIIFSTQNKCRYWSASPSCPKLALTLKQNLPTLPALPNMNSATKPSEFIEVDADDWLLHPRSNEVQMQMLKQSNGYSMLLLICEDALPDGSEDENDLEDSYERFNRFQGR